MKKATWKELAGKTIIEVEVCNDDGQSIEFKFTDGTSFSILNAPKAVLEASYFFGDGDDDVVKRTHRKT